MTEVSWFERNKQTEHNVWIISFAWQWLLTTRSVRIVLQDAFVTQPQCQIRGALPYFEVGRLIMMVWHSFSLVWPQQCISPLISASDLAVSQCFSVVWWPYMVNTFAKDPDHATSWLLYHYHISSTTPLFAPCWYYQLNNLFVHPVANINTHAKICWSATDARYPLWIRG